MDEVEVDRLHVILIRGDMICLSFEEGRAEAGHVRDPARSHMVVEVAMGQS